MRLVDDADPGCPLLRYARRSLCEDDQHLPGCNIGQFGQDVCIGCNVSAIADDEARAAHDKLWAARCLIGADGDDRGFGSFNDLR